MSNEVYGYLIANELLDHNGLCSELQKNKGVGITPIPFSELINFPEKLLPSNSNDGFAFIIGDKPGKSNATYLVDFVDYAPEAGIGMDLSGKKRLELLVNLIISMIHDTGATRFVVAITDSSQIEQAKSVKLADLEETLNHDLEEFAPPDCVYDVIID